MWSKLKQLIREGQTTGQDPYYTGRRVGKYFRKKKMSGNVDDKAKNTAKLAQATRIGNKIVDRGKKHKLKIGRQEGNLSKVHDLLYTGGLEDGYYRRKSTKKIKEGLTTGKDPYSTGIRVGKAVTNKARDKVAYSKGHQWYGDSLYGRLRRYTKIEKNIMGRYRRLGMTPSSVQKRFQQGLEKGDALKKAKKLT